MVSFLINKFPLKWKYLIQFVQFMLFISFYVLKNQNYFYFVFFVLSVGMLSISYFLLNFKFSPKPMKNYLIIFLLFLSMVTFTALSLASFYNYENNDNESPEGNQGRIGPRGHDGEQALVKNENELCAELMEKSANDTIINYMKKNNVYLEDKDNQFFKNLYLKRKFKQICRSTHFKNKISQEGSYNAISFMKQISKNGRKLFWVMNRDLIF